MTKPKVLFLNPTMPPRAIPICSLLAKNKSYHWKFLFYSVSSKIRRWENKNKKSLLFDYEVLKTVDLGWGGKDFISNPISLNFLQRLLAYNPDFIIVPGWADLQSWISALYCIIFKKKYILRSESTRFEKSWRRSVFYPITRLMVRYAYGYTVTGTLAKEYLISLGAKPHRVFIGFSTVDVKSFNKLANVSKKDKNHLRKQWGVEEKDVVLMFSGQLIERKGIYDLLNVYKDLLKNYSNIKLLIVGYGQEEEKVKAKVVKQKLVGNVIFTGFVENKQLPKLYAMADIFVLPSREETWGMVINEAMACGLPVVASDRVGSGYDLVENGKTGLIFKSGNTKDLYRKLDLLIEHPVKRRKMSERSSEKILKYDFKQLVKAIVESLKT
jgi:glycosyltransferase involved in cell wall biosynthesis